MENVQTDFVLADHGKSLGPRQSGYGGFAGYNSQWEDVVLGVEANYLHGKFGGSQTASMATFFSLPSGSTNSATYQGTRR